MWKKIRIGLIVVLGVLLALVAFVASRPSEYVVVRQATVGAPPSTVYDVIADFRNWKSWSPWADLDPSQVEEYGGAPSGEGATYHWSGNDQVGEGRMTITQAQPGALVRIKLEFIRPFPSENVTELTMAPQGAGTLTTWRFIGHNDFMGKAFGLFVDMDTMLGTDFEKGLARLDRTARGGGQAR